MSVIFGTFGRIGVALRGRLTPAACVSVAVAAAALPQYAAAQATPGPEAKAGAPGLPDGRVYEEVSPANKGSTEVDTDAPFAISGVDGNEVLYYITFGAPSEASASGLQAFAVSRRGPGGWSTRGALPRGNGKQSFLTNSTLPNGYAFSANLNGILFGADDSYGPEQEPTSPLPHLYRYSDEDGQLQWLGKPTLAEPLAITPKASHVVGASPDLNTVYFGFAGALVAEDEEANPALGNVSRVQQIKSHPNEPNDGFYEWHEGTLRSAGVLPNGHLDPYGAAPAATVDESGYGAQNALGNEVSEDSSKAVFVSPDPKSGSTRPVEVYVREPAPGGGKISVLASRDLLLPEAEGLPAAAPSGVVAGIGPANFIAPDSFAYASADGSRVFFESADRLTGEAPADALVKVYEFDTETNTLTYLPGLADASPPEFCFPKFCENRSSGDRIVASSKDGSSFLFTQDRSGEAQLELWNEGNVTDIGGGSSKGGAAHARVTADGSEYVFASDLPFVGMGFNSGAPDTQVYMYLVATGELSCLSCAPKGVEARPASLADATGAVVGLQLWTTASNRDISEDGSRVFFETEAALVPQDTDGVSDVYEWENGTVHLISTGVSREAAYFGDNSPSGDDVFFITSESLTPADTDGGYDVYDARVPRPGDQLPPSAVPCEGSVCQGPPSVPNLLSLPSSSTFSGAGNLTAPSEVEHRRKPVKKKKKTAKHKHHGKHARAHAQHHNGRGK